MYPNLLTLNSAGSAFLRGSSLPSATTPAPPAVPSTLICGATLWPFPFPVIPMFLRKLGASEVRRRGWWWPEGAAEGVGLGVGVTAL